MSVYGTAALATALGLLFGVFFGILACFEIGYRFGRRDSRKIHELAYVGTGNIEAALFALLGLLLGSVLRVQHPGLNLGTSLLSAKLTPSVRPIFAWTCFL